MAHESPTYRVDEQFGDVELRRYEAHVVAETLVPGSLERAGNGGFRRLAGYIFGGNETAAGASTKISMTTPVTQSRVGDDYRVRFMRRPDAPWSASRSGLGTTRRGRRGSGGATRC